MTPQDMDALIEAHVAAEKSGDISAAVAMYTDDIEHDIVGAPGGTLHGPEAAAHRYKGLLRDMQTDELVLTRTYYGDDFCVIEHQSTGRVVGQFFGSAAKVGRCASVSCTSSSFATAASAGRTSGWTPALSSAN